MMVISCQAVNVSPNPIQKTKDHFQAFPCFSCSWRFFGWHIFSGRHTRWRVMISKALSKTIATWLLLKASWIDYAMRTKHSGQKSMRCKGKKPGRRFALWNRHVELRPAQRQHMFTLERANLVAARTMALWGQMDIYQRRGIPTGKDTDMPDATAGVSASATGRRGESAESEAPVFDPVLPSAEPVGNLTQGVNSMPVSLGRHGQMLPSFRGAS